MRQGKTNITRLSAFFTLMITTMTYFTPVLAQGNYRSEFSFGYLSSEDDENNESTLYGATAEFYFSEVDTTEHPYAEAAFLERMGSVGLIVGNEKLELGSFVQADGPFYGAMISFMRPGSPMAVQAVYLNEDAAFDPPLNGDAEVDSYALSVGYFLSDGLMGSIGYRRVETDFAIPILAANQTTEHNEYELGLKWVKENLEGSAINIEGSLGIDQFDDGTDDGSNAIVGLSGDYYFNRKLSLGAGMEINAGDDEDDEGHTLAIDFTAFVISRFAIHLGFEKFIADNNQGEDEDTLVLGVMARY